MADPNVAPVPTALNNTALVNDAGVLTLNVKAPLLKDVNPVLSIVEIEPVLAPIIAELLVNDEGVSALILLVTDPPVPVPTLI